MTVSDAALDATEAGNLQVCCGRFPRAQHGRPQPASTHASRASRLPPHRQYGHIWHSPCRSGCSNALAGALSSSSPPCPLAAWLRACCAVSSGSAPKPRVASRRTESVSARSRTTSTLPSDPHTTSRASRSLPLDPRCCCCCSCGCCCCFSCSGRSPAPPPPSVPAPVPPAPAPRPSALPISM
eukprot:2844627-Rhodomonas_salina.1